jgi:hypothetical protein
MTYGLTADLPGVTCLDIMIMSGNTLPSGNFYWIKPGDGNAFRVYCDMTTGGGGWTMIESFAYSNQTPQAAPFRDFGYDIAVNEDAPSQWQYYRLGASRMSALRGKIQRWRATCNADTNPTGVMSRDYVVVRQAVFDFMSNGGGCVYVDAINVRGITCSTCLVSISQGNSSPFLDHLYISSSTYCGSGSISNSGAISGENNWGNYINPNGNFGCSSSLTATTNWWVRPDCWCANGGTCTAIGGYPCLCPFPYSGPNCMQSATCNNVTWNATNVCSGNGKCVAQDVCQCNEFYGGKDCENYYVYGMSKEYPGTTCYDIMVMNPGAPSGSYYWIKPGDEAFRVYCDMTTHGGGWTMIESFAYSNQTPQAAPFRDFAFDSPVNQDAPNQWQYYRLGLSRMQQLKNKVQRWRATCNADTNPAGVATRDFVIVRQAIRDYMSPAAGCIMVDGINVRGVACSNCLVNVVEGGNSPFRDHLYINSNTYCGTNSIPNTGSVSGETNFGYYTNPNGNFGCSASSTSTTNFFVKPDCWCANGGSCTAIGGYPCKCDFPFTGKRISIQFNNIRTKLSSNGNLFWSNME